VEASDAAIIEQVALEEPGWHDVTWDGSTDGSGRAGSGLYYARFRAEGHTFHQRIVWLR